ncbi:MAG: hypothetical protein HY870_02000, partial [Chloroflexi bacterium]|nr:hypothetical protein [Chloroflexota bacterium]
GTQMLSLMLVRDVTRDEEGVTDRAYHTLRYAYVPHLGKVQVGDISRRASEFNQPLIPVWHTADSTFVQLPFCGLISNPTVTTSTLCNDSRR